jgi:DNA polymerase elongation subunit (family B)
MFETFEHRSYLYVEKDYGNDGTSIYGTSLERLSFKSVASRKQWINKNPNKRLFECLNPTKEFLLDRYLENHEEKDFSQFPLRTHFCDIEIAIENEFPNPYDADYPINVITTYDSYKEMYFSFVVDNGENEFISTDNVIFSVFDNEIDMLDAYLEFHKSNIPDIITGWNICGFDIPYIVNRINKALPFGRSSDLSPLDKNPKYRYQFNKENPKEYEIDGLSIIDYMKIYKKFKHPAQPSYSLENICQTELGEGKISYQGHSMKSFYKKEFRKFVDYNIRDVELMVKLDNKMKYLDVGRSLCNLGLVEYESVHASFPYLFGALVIEARKKDKIIVTEMQMHSEEDGRRFEGAFVFQPISGVYRNGVASFDLNSLYPNICITQNVSPETKIGKLVKDLGDSYEIMLLGKKKIVGKEELKKIAIRSENNVLYCKHSHKTGIVPSLLERLYEGRKTDKKKIGRITRKLNDDEISDEQKNDLNSDKEYWVMQSYTKKIALNSIYGCMGNEYFPIYDVDLAESITISGRQIIKESAEYIRKLFNNDKVIISGDTDSLFVNIEKIISKLFGTTDIKWNKTNIKKISKVLDKINDKINERVNEIIDLDFWSEKPTLEFEREKICSEAIFLPVKKRYVLHCKDVDGEYCDKFMYTGVDVKRNEINESLKVYIKEMIEKSLIEKWDNSKYHIYLTKLWEKFQLMEIEKVMMTKGYRTEKTSNGFQTEKGTLAHVRGLKYYNELIKKMGIDKDQEYLHRGDKVKFIYLKSNVYGINAMAYKTDWPKEFNKIFVCDYKKMFEKTILKPMEKIEDVFGFTRFTFNEIIQGLEGL